MQCPGQDTRYWKPGDIFESECPHCGKIVEFFKDEATRKCKNCKNTVLNPKMDFGCAAYCKFAAECLGELGPELLAKRGDLLKDRVAQEVKRRLGQDFKSLAHAVKVARYAEEIAREEKTDPAVVLCAAYLHPLTDLEGGADRQEGVVREVLESQGAGADMIDPVLDIIERFQKGDPGDSIGAKVFSDAHLLASDASGETGYLTRSGGDIAAREQAKAS